MMIERGRSAATHRVLAPKNASTPPWDRRVETSDCRYEPQGATKFWFSVSKVLCFFLSFPQLCADHAAAGASHHGGLRGLRHYLNLGLRPSSPPHRQLSWIAITDCGYLSGLEQKPLLLPWLHIFKSGLYLKQWYYGGYTTLAAVAQLGRLTFSSKSFRFSFVLYFSTANFLHYFVKNVKHMILPPYKSTFAIK